MGNVYIYKPLSSCQLLRLAISNSHSVYIVYMLLLVCVNFTMCLHSVVDRMLSNCHDKYTNVSLDEFDNCDYVTRITDVSKNDLIVIQLNIRGISSKRTQLMNLIDTAVHDREPDLILLSETWLTPFSPAFSIPGYELHHLDRKNKKGGGVGILSSSKLRCMVRTDLSSNLPESECITLEIALRNGEHCLVSSMYRPPKTAKYLCSWLATVRLYVQ